MKRVIITLILLMFAFVGNGLLAALGISLMAFKTAGGVLLFMIALDMVFEKRRHPRVHVRWTAIVETRRGPIEAKTRNISLGGAFIEYPERAELEDNFAIIFKPSEERTFSVVGEKVWCGNINKHLLNELPIVNTSHASMLIFI